MIIQSTSSVNLLFSCKRKCSQNILILILHNQCSFSDLEALRTQTQNAQNESATAASQASAVFSMNMKLQSTISKSQARSIDAELHKIEAAECKELLAIVQVGGTSCYLS